MKEYKRRDRRDTEPDPSKLQPNGRSKPEPRYRVERHWPGWHSVRCHYEGHWGVIAKCRTLDEAVHQMRKPMREGYWRDPIAVRIIDTTDGSVVRTEVLPPKVTK